jgi:prepilin-type N-terminal cleavage/methylation domain-containing protein
VYGCRRPVARSGDEGFTLIEVMVALVLTAIVMAAALAMLLATMKGTATVRKDTQAKNLTQERIDQMRDLRYHVDRQNGPYIDLLDIYYTNVSGAVTTVSAGGATLSGNFIASGGGTGGEPPAPFYRVSTGPISGASSFSQVIDTQFLAADGTALPASNFSTYDSQVAGKDAPPSLMVGVTVITTWTDAGKTKTNRTYTRITDGRPQAPVVQSQARAVALDITSTAADGTTLELQGGVANLDGAQSSGSSVSGYLTGALATRTGQTPVTGLVSQFSLPSQAVTSTGSSSNEDPGSCSWYGFGRTGTSDSTGDVSAGLPLAPLDVNAATPLNQASGYIQANSGGSCGLLSYDNTVGGGTVRTGSGVPAVFGPAPFIQVPDIVAGSGAAVSGSGYVTTNPLASSPQQTKAGASAFTSRSVVAFPNSLEALGNGLVRVALNSSSVDCVSGSGASAGTVTGKYSVTVKWWGRDTSNSLALPGLHTATWTYDSSAATPLTMSGEVWNPSRYALSNGITLDQVVTLSAPAVVTAGATNGLRGFPNGVVTITTAPTLQNETAPGYSAINVAVGRLTCVADDQR